MAMGLLSVKYKSSQTPNRARLPTAKSWLLSCSYVKPKLMIPDYTQIVRLVQDPPAIAGGTDPNREVLINKPPQLHTDRKPDGDKGGDEGGEARAHQG